MHSSFKGTLLPYDSDWMTFASCANTLVKMLHWLAKRIFSCNGKCWNVKLSVHVLTLCVQISHVCSNISCVFKYLMYVAISHVCSNISFVFKYLMCVQISHVCSNISCVFKYLMCVQIPHVCSNISCMFKYLIAYLTWTAATLSLLITNILIISLYNIFISITYVGDFVSNTWLWIFW